MADDGEGSVTCTDGDITELYRAFDSSGVLLYVGISFSAVHRLKAHMRAAEWPAYLASLTIERFSNRASALDAERSAIISEKPAFNIVHSTDQAKDVPDDAFEANAQSRRALARLNEFGKTIHTGWAKGCLYRRSVEYVFDVDIVTLLAVVEGQSFPKSVKLGKPDAWPVTKLRQWIVDNWPEEGLGKRCDEYRHQSIFRARSQFANPEWKRALIAWLESVQENHPAHHCLVWGRDLTKICGLRSADVKELVRFELLSMPGGHNFMNWCWSSSELLQFLTSDGVKARAA